MEFKKGDKVKLNSGSSKGMAGIVWAQSMINKDFFVVQFNFGKKLLHKQFLSLVDNKSTEDKSEFEKLWDDKDE